MFAPLALCPSATPASAWRMQCHTCRRHCAADHRVPVAGSLLRRAEGVSRESANTRKTRDFSPERGSVWGSGCACRSSKSAGVLHPRGAALRLARLKPLPTAEHFPSRFAHQKTYHQTLTPPPSGAAPAVRTHSPVALPRSRGDRDGKGLLERSQFACLTGVFVLFMFFSAHAALAARNLTIE